ncbi:MAG: transketolase family protein [Spirochaetes bacterium]|nr:transketolase family protein [Spirochaetota bacterium]
MKATRQSFGEALIELGARYDNLVVLDADLLKSVNTHGFAQRFPQRFIQMGIAESNMLGVAAGLALSGFIPFACSFASFLSGRYETIRISVAYSKANVKIVGTHCGVGIGEDGHTQMGLEDISIMRNLPGITVIQPVDDIETRQAVEFAIHHDHAVYLRLTRQPVEQVNKDDYRFEWGKGVVLKEGSDILLLATGALVYNVLQAARELEKENIHARVVNIHTIKPIDRALLLKQIKKTKRIMTFEDHSIIGGLGSAVAEVISEQESVGLKRIGINDTFGESGSMEELYRKFGFDKESIKQSIKRFLRRD